MEVFGTTRSRVRRTHALITPDSFVTSELPGWEGTQCIILISPRIGARFVQYLALMEPGGTAAPPAPAIERLLYVLEGEVSLWSHGASDDLIGRGGFAFCPAGVPLSLRAKSRARLNVFEKRYVPLAGTEVPSPIAGHEGAVDGAPFFGNPDAVLKVLLPRDARFDMAVNVFAFQPGATLPMVELHVMEHGLLMLEGQGVYRLGDDWYPVRQGDVIWMAPYCPQWFVAMGTGPARYLYYKDVNRDPLEDRA
jgi:(S)-ureidoglycine aminohydrolase